MRSSINSVLAVSLVCVVGLGCNMSEKIDSAMGNANAANKSNANANKPEKSLTQKAMESAVGEEKVGIPACDEALEMLAEQASNPDDNVIVQAGKKTALNRFRTEIRNRLEQKKANRDDVEKFCRDFRDTIIGEDEPANIKP